MSSIQKLFAEIELEINILQKTPPTIQMMTLDCVDNKLNNLMKMGNEIKNQFLTDENIQSRLALLRDVQWRLVNLSRTPMSNDQMCIEIEQLEQYAKKNYHNVVIGTDSEPDLQELKSFLRISEPGAKYIDNARLVSISKQNEDTVNQYKSMVLKLESEKQNLEEDLDLLDRRNGDLIKELDQNKAKYESEIIQLKEELEKAKASAMNKDTNVSMNFNGTAIFLNAKGIQGLQLGNHGVMTERAEIVQQRPLEIGN